MADNGALLGIIGALGVAVVAGGDYIVRHHGAFDSAPPTTAAIPPAPAPAPSSTPLHGRV